MGERQPPQYDAAPPDETYLLSKRELLTPQRGPWELVIPQPGFWVERPKAEQAPSVADLYKRAYDRSDYFAGRYEDPDSTIFNPDWFKHDFEENPDHKWFVFTDDSGQVVGITGFFHDYDIDGYPVMTSDETQIAPQGRGYRIMDHFFRRVVPRIEAAGDRLATSFVLTPETKGLRRTLESELGMFSLGILPHVLKHRVSGVTRSEIVSAKFDSFQPQPVAIHANLEPLYRIVKSQIPDLPEPVILPAEQTPVSRPVDNFEESLYPASGADPEQQRYLLRDGFKPVAYYPRLNSFVMAKFPEPMPELGFLIENESIEANKDLARYLQEELYNQSERSA
jgi:hypothetical protein